MRAILLMSVGLPLIVACNKKEDSTTTATPTETQSQLPAGHPPTTGVSDLPTPPSGTIEGRIELGDVPANSVSPGDVIFLIARNAGTNRTVAVAKLAAPEKFPLPFQLSGDNVMMAGQSLSGKLRVLARVDKDGDAISKTKGDVVGEVSGLVEVPAENVVLKLSSVLP